jgi:hypothetical protein
MIPLVGKPAISADPVREYRCFRAIFANCGRMRGFEVTRSNELRSIHQFAAIAN